MGKNLPAKKHKVGQPTHRYLRYILDHNANAVYGNNDSHYIDLAQGLSVMNRRAYRQGLYYYVSSITVHDSNQDVWVKFATAPDTWYVKNSWTRAFRAWSKMNSISSPGNDLDIASQYHDFKIWLSTNHRLNTDSNLLPYGKTDYDNVTIGADGIWSTWSLNTAQPLAAGEWEKSKIYNAETGLDKDFILLGDTTADSYGMLNGYMNTRRSVPSESPDEEEDIDTTDFIVNMFTETTGTQDNVITDMQDKNDEPPYHPTLHAIETFIVAQTANSAGAGSVTRTPGFVVPFGLLEVITNSATDGKIEVVVELASGSYNGVAAARVV